jgi:hypothetical protein
MSASVLRQSTSAVRAIGPFVDYTNGALTEEALTVTNAEIFLIKNGAGTAAKNDATSLVHLNGGMYSLTLDTTDTNTVGELAVIINDAANAARPLSAYYQVLEENVYDELYVAAATLGTNVDLILADTAELQTDWTNGGRLDLILDAILADTAELQTDWVNGGRLDLLIDALTTSLTTIDNFLDTEIAAILALLDDARAEPAQGAPPVNPDAMTKIDYLYKAWRNKCTQTATQTSIYNDAAAVIDHKITLSSDGTTMTRGEVATGP